MINNFKTFFLMAVLTTLFVAAGSLLAGKEGAIIAFIIALFTNFFAFWFSGKMVLKRYNAQEISSPDNRLYNIVKNLSAKADLPIPKVYIVPQSTSNAFATGRSPKHAAVAATEGIINILNDDELSGVMAHELTHVKNRDMLTGTIAATFAGAITMLSQFAMISARGSKRSNPLLMIPVLILAPLVAMFVRMAISRVREFAADKGGAEISGKPLSLASALAKLHEGVSRNPLQNGNPAHSNLFIVNPFGGGGLQKLFASHPPVEDRIRKLREIASGNG
jgi:heat shock protein HtpX